ncbi:hypothetical protein [Enterococcus villorum]|nr:hypothetical protein [Enterococcus villorum]
MATHLSFFITSDAWSTVVEISPSSAYTIVETVGDSEPKINVVATKNMA